MYEPENKYQQEAGDIGESVQEEFRDPETGSRQFYRSFSSAPGMGIDDFLDSVGVTVKPKGFKDGMVRR